MKKIILLLLAYLSLSTIYAQNTIKVLDQDNTETSVSPFLWGSYYEIGYGRSDLLWGELLFNRSFENTKPVSESNGWYTAYRGDVSQAQWWHSGYEEPNGIYSLTEKRKKTSSYIQ